jgi:hypothetical protein
MWSDRKSIVLSRIAVILFMAALVAAAVFAPWLVDRLFTFTDESGPSYFLATTYVGAVPAALLLISLYRLLRRIEKGSVFIHKNVSSLRYISWYCFAGAVISLASSFYYLPWIMVAVAAAFVGLIVRVVKNVFAKAVSLQDDADFTI